MIKYLRFALVFQHFHDVIYISSPTNAQCVKNLIIALQLLKKYSVMHLIPGIGDYFSNYGTYI